MAGDSVVGVSLRAVSEMLGILMVAAALASVAAMAG